MAAWGHKDAFLRPRVNAGYRFSKGTLAGTRGNGGDAPIPDARGRAGPADSGCWLTKPSDRLPRDAMGRVNAGRNGVGCRRENITAKFYVANPRFNSPKSRSVNRSDNAEAFCRT